MSTVEDFKSAPVGAIATRNTTGSRAVKTYEDKWSWVPLNGFYSEDKEMAKQGCTLDPPAPTTAREALDLAWDLAHEVKPGQVIPKGSQYLGTTDSGLKEYTAAFDIEIGLHDEPERRTLEPLPDSEPDWLDAPAVLAWSRWDDVRREKVWSKADECYKSTDGEIANWNDLRNVAPLYPKGQEA